jgi:hypothetical protein
MCPRKLYSHSSRPPISASIAWTSFSTPIDEQMALLAIYKR